MTFTDYARGSSGSAGSSPDTDRTIKDSTDYWTLAKCKKGYLNYLASKQQEIKEAQEARRYRHGSQWTAEQIRILKARGQPASTFNRIGRKIDGIVGLLERQRRDPKGSPRTPQHEQGAELATAALRYVMDQQQWPYKSPLAASDAACEGIGGIELNIIQGDRGDKEVEIDVVDPDSFFYDPRSFQLDFSDARYMGVGKWIDVDQAKEMFPDKEDEIDAAVESGSDLVTDSDRDNRWFSSEGDLKRIRMVDLWYKHGGGWCYCIFTGATKLQEGKSYLIDEKKKPYCKYVVFSGNVDQDGDRYGFVRGIKSAQDSLNFKESKLNHILGSKRLIMDQSAVQDIEVARKEWARPDGVIVKNPGGEVIADDMSFDFAGWSKLLDNAKAEIENFSFNPALIGTGVTDMSGRAIALQQQAGMAELGPYIIGYQGWKIRVYRAIWNAIRQHWTGERWIRVTDDEEIAQFIQINGVGIDPQTGMSTIVNALGSLDVDIILDEGPDQVNMQGDAYETLTTMASKGAQMPPEVLIELSPLPGSVKKKLNDLREKAAQQPNPEIQMKQAEMQMKQQADQAAVGLQQQKMQMEMDLKQQESAAKAQAMREEMDLKQQQAMAEMHMERQKVQQQIELEREKARAQIEIERFKAEVQGEIAQDKAEADAKRADKMAQHKAKEPV